MKVLKQFLKEFWVPTIVGLFWAYINAPKLEAENNLLNHIKYFGTAFFLVSWFGGQILRIIKQHKLDGNLASLLDRLEKVSDKIENVYKDIKGYTTGGESFCYLDISRYGDTYITGVVHHGTYPLYDIIFRLHNLNNSEHNDITKRPTIEIGDLGPGLVKQLVNEIQIEESDDNYIKYTIGFYSRKGHFEQDLRIIKFEGVWFVALQVREKNNIIFTKMDESFPIKEPFRK